MTNHFRRQEVTGIAVNTKMHETHQVFWQNCNLITEPCFLEHIDFEIRNLINLSFSFVVERWTYLNKSIMNTKNNQSEKNFILLLIKGSHLFCNIVRSKIMTTSWTLSHLWPCKMPVLLFWHYVTSAFHLSHFDHRHLCSSGLLLSRNQQTWWCATGSSIFKILLWIMHHLLN